MAINVRVSVGNVGDGVLNRYIDLSKVTGGNGDTREAEALGESLVNGGKTETTAVNEGLGVMNSIDPEIDIERLAIHLLLSSLPILLGLRVPLTATFVRGYSFKLSLSLMPSEPSLAPSSPSSTVASSTGFVLLTCALTGGGIRFADRRGHWATRHLVLLYLKQRPSFLPTVHFCLVHPLCTLPL